MDPKPQQAQRFYRWVDAQGQLHVVSSLDLVPSAERGRAEVVALNGADAVSAQVPAVRAAGLQLDWLSFAAGFVAALALSLLFTLLPSSWRGVSRVVVLLAVAALGTGAYLGFVRRSAGLSDGGALTTPGALLQDAKSAVEQMNTRQKQQEEELRKIQAEGR